MDFIIGLLTGFGIIIGIVTILKNNKTRGIMEIILSVLALIITYAFISKKNTFVFGGSNGEFLIQSAIVDKMLFPWIILLIYIALIVLTVINIYKLKESKNWFNNN